MSVVLGEGDHTYNEIVIMEPEEFEQYKELEFKINGKRKDDITHPDDEEEEEEDEVENELNGVEEVKNVDINDLED